MGVVEDLERPCNLSTNLLISPSASGRIRTDDRRFTKLPVDLATQLLDAIITLGDVARQLKLTLSSNGHKAEKLDEVEEALLHREG